MATCGGVISKLLEQSCSQMAKEADKGDDVLNDASEGFLADAAWQKLAGRGYKKTAFHMGDSRFCMLIALLWVLMEPLRWLHLFFMKSSLADPTAAKTGYPAIIQLLNARSSILVMILQYYTTMLRFPGRCTRLRLVG